LPKPNIRPSHVAVEAEPVEWIADVSGLSAGKRHCLPLVRTVVAEKEVREVRVPSGLAMACADIARVWIDREAPDPNGVEGNAYLV